MISGEGSQGPRKLIPTLIGIAFNIFSPQIIDNPF
jgi:hypothetical protein